MSSVGSARRKRLLLDHGFVGNAVDRVEVPGRVGTPPAGDLPRRLVLIRVIDTRGVSGLGIANVVLPGATVAEVMPIASHEALPVATAAERDWLRALALARTSNAGEHDRWLLVVTTADLPSEVSISLVDGATQRAGFELATLGPVAAPAALRVMSRLNAIDHVVVLDSRVTLTDRLRQRVLLVRFLHAAGVDRLRGEQIRVEGGERVQNVAVMWAWPLWRVADIVDATLTAQERSQLDALDASMSIGEPERWLIVLVDRRGDFSPYTLSVVPGVRLTGAAEGFDPVLSRVEVRFKVDCPAPFDCRSPEPPEPPPAPSPPSDYLARDFHALRRLMLDRLDALRSGTRADHNPASLRSTLVDLVAYAADELSWMQDAVANEAYLTTARRRTSVRRHARALDYQMHEGVAARAWVQLRTTSGVRAVGDVVLPGDRFCTAVEGFGPVADPARAAEALRLGATFFEAVTSLRHLVFEHGEIRVHDWGEDDATLPAGATEAVLVDPGIGTLALVVGDVLIFEATGGGINHLPVDADPTMRHAVRLTAVAPDADPLLGVRLLRVRWDSADALPFELPLTAGGLPVAAARGDVVLVDHGARVSETQLPTTAWGTAAGARLRLTRAGLAWVAPLRRQRAGPSSASAVDLGESTEDWSAVDGLAPDPRAAVPAIRLTRRETSETWQPVADLLNAPSDAAVFVAEREADGVVTLRFGDGVHGRSPPTDATFTADYRLGGGAGGNVGAGSIQHMLSRAPVATQVVAVVQPMAASGGAEPEDIESVRILAPRAYRGQLRAVTLEDWAEVAGRHPEVQRAVARLHWLGSRNLVQLHVDRRGGLAVDDTFRDELIAWLEPYRLTGYELGVASPRQVAIELALTVVCAPGFYRAHVAAELTRVFGRAPLAEGGLGWFHPDRFTFGDEVFLSPIIARAMAVPGVVRVDASPKNPSHRFRRTTETTDHLDDGRLEIGDLEIARCDNDPSAPEHGRFTFLMEGGA